VDRIKYAHKCLDCYRRAERGKYGYTELGIDGRYRAFESRYEYLRTDRHYDRAENERGYVLIPPVTERMIVIGTARRQKRRDYSHKRYSRVRQIIERVRHYGRRRGIYARYELGYAEHYIERQSDNERDDGIFSAVLHKL